MRVSGRVLVVLALLLGACGDDNSGSADGSLDLGSWLDSGTTTSTTSSTTTSSTVVSGGLFDDSGAGTPGSGLFDNHDFESDGSTPEAPVGGGSDIAAFYGSDLVDAAMGEALLDACAGGDMQACDTMYLDSAPESEAEAFGATCAGELPSADQYCVDLGGSATGTYAPLPGSFTGQAAEGIESTLVNACWRGSMNACDALYDLNLGETSRAYGATCGDRIDTDQYCAALWGLGYDWGVAWRDMVGI